MTNDDDVSALAGQLGLPPDQAQAALDALLAEMEIAKGRSTAGEEALPEAALGERFGVGDLLQAMGAGADASEESKQKPDLTELAKDELAKAVAKKLGIDPATAGPIVQTLLDHLLGKQTTTRRRRKTAKRPASSSSSSKRRKAKKPASSSGSASAKPAARKKRRKTASSSTSTSSASASRPAPRKKTTKRKATKRKTSSSKRPAAASSSAKRKKARRGASTRGASEAVVSE